MAGRVFDLRKPETLLIPDELDDDLRAHVNERVFKSILMWAYKLDVSDVAFQEGMPVMIKKNNLVFPISKAKITSISISRFIGIIYGSKEGDNNAFQRVLSGDGTNYSYKFTISKPGEERREIRFRTNAIRDGSDNTGSIRLRLNNETIYTLEEIGLSPEHEIYKNMFPTKGMVLITGSVDSGKTTLIYSCLRHFIESKQRPAFIDTFENPIEGNLKKVAMKCENFQVVVNQCPVPIGVKSFSGAIPEILRRNTDITLLGEVRTSDEAIGLIQGTLATGKLMLATLHTDSVPVTFSRLLEMLRMDSEAKTRSMVFDLISNLSMIVSQKLLTTVELKRIAVNETLVFTREIQDRLKKVEIEHIAKEIALIMIESENTMVHKARRFHKEGILSDEVFFNFEKDYSY